jgi:hypothetical protein
MLLLCALALSVIGMHHVPLSPHVTMSVEAHAAPEATSRVVAAMPEATSPAVSSGTGMGHDLLHMCLAVLWATGGFLFLAWLLIAVGAAAALAAGLRPWSRRVWRPPRAAGRSLLALVCVLRT